MRALGLSGAAPGRKPRATGPAEGDRAPTGLLRRDFTATGPNRRWVVDFTHVPTWSGYSLHGVRHGPVRPPHRRLGHQRAHGAPTTRAAPWNTRSRRARNAGARTWRGWCTTATADPSHLSIAYTGRLVDEGIEASAGAVGSSYDNAAAEALNKSYKRELVWRDGPWKGRDDLETATARWVDWYNRTRPHLTNDDDLPPTTVEHRYNHNHTTTPPTTV